MHVVGGVVDHLAGDVRSGLTPHFQEYLHYL
jgi:hypothetical protein